VEDFTDGGKAVVYRGINRGAYLALGDLQQAVINVLSNIKNSASMKKLMESAKF
jgi:beta-glucosidase